MFESVPWPPLSLAAYRLVAGDEPVDEILGLARQLRSARVLHLSSTRFGGGVAELLPTLTALMRDCGIQADWQVVPGNERFFYVTKRLHNGLQGMEMPLDEAARRTYLEMSETFARAFPDGYDFVVVHDPQPAAIRSFLPDAGGKWIWRCHIDLPGPWGSKTQI